LIGSSLTVKLATDMKSNRQKTQKQTKAKAPEIQTQQDVLKMHIVTGEK
jgi:hypothetical protein